MRRSSFRATIAALAVAAVALTPLAFADQPAAASVAPAVAGDVRTAATQASTTTLIPLNSTWAYRYAAEWPSGWQSAGFGHASWAQGAAPLGWGENAQTNVNPAGTATKPVSMLFRKHFDVSNPSQLSDVKISVMVDDGVAVWVNGTEVGRANLRSGQLTANTYANKAPNAATARQLVTFTVPRDLLRSGQNTVAASTHVNWRSTPNAAFEATLIATTGTPAANDPPAEPPAAACGAQGKIAPACGALWGVYRIDEGPKLTSVITNFEAQMGRKFDITLRYHDFSTHMHQGLFPDSHQITLGQERTLLFAWQSRVSSTNTTVAWSSIASGQQDKFIDSAADRVKAFGKPVMIAFDPEFDNKKNGSMADYIKAYQRIHDRFKAKGVTNVAWLWVSTGYLGAGNDKKIMSGYPGHQYVDWVGYDPYNFYTCNGSGWTSFEQDISPTHNYFVAQGLGDKPQILMEYGTAYDPNNQARSNQWNKDIPSVLKKYPNIKALVRFDSNGTLSTGKKCDTRIDNGPGMLASFKQAGLDPYLNTRK